MPEFDHDLQIEERRLRVVYKLLHGLLDEDIRKLHIPGDVHTAMKRDLEIKGWNRNNWLPLETWSVLETNKLGWGWDSSKLKIWFVRDETEEALSIPMSAIRNFLSQTKISQKEELTCNCGKIFKVATHQSPYIIKQDIQWSNQKRNHKYHSACLFVKPEAFTTRNYHGKPPSRQDQVVQIKLPFI